MSRGDYLAQGAVVLFWYVLLLRNFYLQLTSFRYLESNKNLDERLPRR